MGQQGVSVFSVQNPSYSRRATSSTQLVSNRGRCHRYAAYNVQHTERQTATVQPSTNKKVPGWLVSLLVSMRALFHFCGIQCACIWLVVQYTSHELTHFVPNRGRRHRYAKYNVQHTEIRQLLMAVSLIVSVLALFVISAR